MSQPAGPWTDDSVTGFPSTYLGPEHLLTLMTAGGLGADLRALGDFEQALVSDRETYEIFKVRFGEDYPLQLAAAHNLATALCHAGQSPCCAASRPRDIGSPATWLGRP